MAITIAEAITSINPKAEISINDNDINTLLWFNNTPVISNADILAKQAELQAEYDAKQYQRDRAKEYPSWQDQLDDIYHNGIDGWKTTIKVTKDKYSKG
jgi:hypothetical protein